MRILVVVGTRPEAIKLAPLIAALRGKRHRVILCATAQHRELLDETLAIFGLRPDVDLNLMRPGQTPAQVMRRCRSAVAKVLTRLDPQIVVVQGDTTSALAAALAADAAGVPVAHVEAGLRSFDRRHPYPEEGNRVRIDAVARLWFAPTKTAARNLRAEGHGPAGIHVTGNTSIDALKWALRVHDPRRSASRKKRLVVVTLHRRESFGRPLEGLMRGIARAAERLPGWSFVIPVHPNPRVRHAARVLKGNPTVRLVEPMGYLDFVRLMSQAEFLVTDSGGIQEEAPTLKKAVLVVRRKTERPELIGRGGKLIGNSGDRLAREIVAWATGVRPKAPRKNPFGDGRTSARIAAALAGWARKTQIF